MKTIIKLQTIVIALLLSIGATAQNQKATFQCNFDCPSCKDKVMKNIPYEKGVKAVEVDYDKKLVTIEFKESKNTINGIQKALVELGYQTQLIGIPQTFAVKGNCDMCKKKIETAAKSIKGVNEANWQVDTKQLTIILNTDSINIQQIHKAIAKAGYNTELVKADEASYNSLHECCKFEK